MPNNISFKVVYKYRFLPLFLSGTLLVITVIFKYALNVDVGSLLGWTVFLNIASFIYYRGVLETKKNKEMKTELEINPPPPLSQEEIEKMFQNEMQDEKQQQIQNIIFRSFYLILGLLLTLGGFSIAVSEKKINYFGVAIFVFGVLFSIYSIFLLRRWILLYRYYKKETTKKVSDKKMTEDKAEI